MRVEIDAADVGAKARQRKAQIGFAAGAFEHTHAGFELELFPNGLCIGTAGGGIAEPFFFGNVTEPFGKRIGHRKFPL